MWWPPGPLLLWILHVGEHDFISMVQLHFRKWIPLYGMSVVAGLQQLF
jgi:hypothetical protein